MSYARVMSSDLPEIACLWVDVQASSQVGSEPLRYVNDKLREAAAHYYEFAISRQRPAERFRQLADWWQEDVSHLSSPTEIAIHPAYQQIIGMGIQAIPFLLKNLEQRPDHWFWALKAITGEDPVPLEQKGRVDQMAKAWLRWGAEHGFR